MLPELFNTPPQTSADNKISKELHSTYYRNQIIGETECIKDAENDTIYISRTLSRTRQPHSIAIRVTSFDCDDRAGELIVGARLNKTDIVAIARLSKIPGQDFFITASCPNSNSVRYGLTHTSITTNVQNHYHSPIKPKNMLFTTEIQSPRKNSLEFYNCTNKDYWIYPPSLYSIKDPSEQKMSSEKEQQFSAEIAFYKNKIATLEQQNTSKERDLAMLTQFLNSQGPRVSNNDPSPQQAPMDDTPDGFVAVPHAGAPQDIRANIISPSLAGLGSPPNQFILPPASSPNPRG